MAYKPNNTGKNKIYSLSFPKDGVVEYAVDGTGIEPPKSPKLAGFAWKQFPYGTAHVLSKNGYKLTQGFDAVLFGNIVRQRP